MTKIPSVEALAKDWLFAEDEPGEEDVLVYEEFKEFLTQALTDQRTALLTELREWTDNYLKKVNTYAESCHKENLIMLAYDAHSREIAIEHLKAHLDELIN